MAESAESLPVMLKALRLPAFTLEVAFLFDGSVSFEEMGHSEIHQTTISPCPPSAQAPSRISRRVWEPGWGLSTTIPNLPGKNEN